ncbi:hypothetical protein [Rhizobium sp. Leaf453]|uniref:hypothetical protein n=1 Tax=Rhizobium sp. Leaf453 TaxID=1736380 RepID=UPI000714711E|nr:hypothetical protein [Rhizobium sp. Leaf453]KQT96967.1 hypothetical protein ASG68_08395 [Rhizobium sp. Leaf453]
MPEPKLRQHQGYSQYEIHRINGESVWQAAIDARRCVREHPGEWAFQPWPEDVQKKAREDMPLSDMSKLVPSNGSGPFV